VAPACPAHARPTPRRARPPAGAGEAGPTIDYQFLGMVAVALAVVTRGSLLPVLAVTGVIAVVTLAYEAGAGWHRRRHARPARRPAPGPTTPPDADLNRWMAAVERLLRSAD